MDYLRSFAISAAGMSAERTRVEVAAANLANANTVQDPSGLGYQPMRAVARAAQGQAFTELVSGGLEGAVLPGVSVEPLATGPRLVHEPGHPLANGQGFVAYPGVDPATEMVTLMSATRAYEANVAAMNTARALALKALEIGRGS
ncbi:flagellar basal body rod protein FlgC [Ramlibacter pallidus]|uniref:Flagellar basal-body rod protein FlgC n=1 Tax=Ramlibacter pallidus TaxID=2780087 RepID=A0ABR9S0Z2_9BURK|nr:flagellar basal body rod protein FlgC [Ramlibacter pallidus]